MYTRSLSAMFLSWSLVTTGLLGTAGTAAYAEQGTVQAMAPWQGSGQVFAVAPEKLMILGSYSGILYLQDKEGILDTALMLCPVVQNLDIKAKKGEASGHCTFTDADDDEVYSEWRCAGVPGACEGDFTITGGTGKFEGITGGGKLLVRAALVETAASLESGSMVRAATGLAIWPDLKYEIPAK